MSEEAQLITEPRKLHDRMPKGPAHRYYAAPYFWLGGGFLVLLGVGIVLAHAGLIGQRATRGVPEAVVYSVAAVSFLVGLALLLAAMFRYQTWQRVQQRGAADEYWLRDYPWHTRRHRINELVKAMGFALGAGVFLAVAGSVAWVMTGAWWELLMVAGAGLVGLACLVGLVLALWNHARYGNSWLRYKRFPFHPGETVELSWGCDRGLGAYNSLCVTLRRVEEAKRVSGGTGKHGGDQETVSYVPHQMWAMTYTIHGPGRHEPNEEIPISFSLPEDAQSTHLDHDPPTYWDLKVEIDVPGLNFEQAYLVPIYARAGKPEPASAVESSG